MWPGLVGKGEGADEPALSWDKMLDLTARTRVNDQRFDGIDIMLMQPHLNPNSDQSEIKTMADQVLEKGLKIGSVVAPIWPDAGGGSAMGSREERSRFLLMVEKACQYSAVLNQIGVRDYGIIRIDSSDSPTNWAQDPVSNTRIIADTFKEAAIIASDYGEKLAAEGEICWAGMHSWHHMVELLELVGMPDRLGFQADLAHTYLFLLGYNAPEYGLLSESHSPEDFWPAYQSMTEALAPWTMDFHVAQSNGTVFGSGSHDKTGRHCPADAMDGKLDVARCAEYWLLDQKSEIRNNIQHLCWDGCMFPNEVLESPATWENVLSLMLTVRDGLEKKQENEQDRI